MPVMGALFMKMKSHLLAVGPVPKLHTDVRETPSGTYTVGIKRHVKCREARTPVWTFDCRPDPTVRVPVSIDQIRAFNRHITQGFDGCWHRSDCARKRLR